MKIHNRVMADLDMVNDANHDAITVAQQSQAMLIDLKKQLDEMKQQMAKDLDEKKQDQLKAQSTALPDAASEYIRLKAGTSTHDVRIRS